MGASWGLVIYGVLMTVAGIVLYLQNQKTAQQAAQQAAKKVGEQSANLDAVSVGDLVTPIAQIVSNTPMPTACVIIGMFMVLAGAFYSPISDALRAPPAKAAAPQTAPQGKDKVGPDMAPTGPKEPGPK